MYIGKLVGVRYPTLDPTNFMSGTWQEGELEAAILLFSKMPERSRLTFLTRPQDQDSVRQRIREGKYDSLIARINENTVPDVQPDYSIERQKRITAAYLRICEHTANLGDI